MGFIILLTALVVLFFLLMFSVSICNGLVALRNRYKNAFTQIDAQLKHRYALIPNLVETAKSCLEHERAILDDVVAARNTASAASVKAAANPGDATMKELSAAETMLAGTLGRLFAVAEANPDLKGNPVAGRLLEELTLTENRISSAQRAYNDAVMNYNTRREVIPVNFAAAAFRFAPAELFVIEKPDEKQALKVPF